MFDDNEPEKKPREYTLGEKLDDFSVADLEELKARLTQEIERVTSEMNSKRASLDAAASIFKN
ncbi:MAG: DUF1192 domain-containing protein [Pseudomonadota bacterium]